jgi:hypothetical protein
MKHYRRNLIRLVNGEPYRLSNRDGFRRIHRELERAIGAQRRIELHILENVELDEIDTRERELIRQRGTLNGPGVSSMPLRPVCDIPNHAAKNE